MTRATGAASDHVAEIPFSLVPTVGLLEWVAAWLGIGLQLRPVTRQELRIAFYFAVTWVAPMGLASLQTGRPGAVSFLNDFETHLRSLVAIPLLVFAEFKIEPEVRYIVRSLTSARRCRRPDELRARVRFLQHLVQHPVARLVLVVLVFLFVPPWIRHHTSGRETWIFRIAGAEPVLTAAGAWTAWVIVPLYMFLLVRWLWRWIVLALVFARSAPLLRPVITHADRCGGFSFVSYAIARFAWVIAGASTLVSSRLLVEVVRQRVSARDVENQALVVVILAVIVAILPLLGFAPRFGRSKRLALRRYRTVVEGHARNVEREWYGRPYPAHVSGEESSSLTDLTSVYECARSMRIVPYSRSHLLVVALAAIVPMLLPVLSASTSIDEIVRKVLRALL